MTIGDVIRNAAQEMLLEKESSVFSIMETGEHISLNEQACDLERATELGYYE